MSNYVVYDPNNTVQTSFLSALALGETGNSSYASTEGYGGVNLAGDTNVDSFGFPLQTTPNVSSAAGTYQFVQGTYDEVAQELGLDNTFSQSDQNEAAWQYAQQVYASNTGGSLYNALSQAQNEQAAGNTQGATTIYQQIQNALSSVWPSVSGNGAAPQGLSGSLLGGQGANVPFPPLTAERLAVQARLIAKGRLHPIPVASLATLKTGSSGSG